MSKDARLTAAQVHRLEGYERHFKQATEAAWCSYPGQAGINTMLEVWDELTGSRYPYQPGCPNCLMNLVRDLGTIYFAQKDVVLEAERQAAEAERKAAEDAAEKEAQEYAAAEAAGGEKPAEDAPKGADEGKAQPKPKTHKRAKK